MYRKKEEEKNHGKSLLVIKRLHLQQGTPSLSFKFDRKKGIFLKH